MSTNQLQEAVTLIKSGDRQKGQQLLAELLRQDPGNENAWLWMSTLVSADKRRLCLEKALSINPGNLQAQKLLAQLKATETASAPQPMAQPQSKQVEPAPAP